jgi:small subunit ribosomal protein S21
MRVEVRNNNLDRALKVMKRKLADDGMFKELQTRQAYEKPSDKRNRKMRAAIVRARKEERLRQEPSNA